MPLAIADGLLLVVDLGGAEVVLLDHLLVGQGAISSGFQLLLVLLVYQLLGCEAELFLLRFMIFEKVLVLEAFRLYLA